MLPRSPLLEVERASGATLRSYRGLELAESYGDETGEYRAARAAAALFDCSFRGVLRFTGPDRVTFLHNLLSNDLVRLRPGQGCYATLLTQQSKVVTDADVLCLEDSVWLLLDLRLAGRAREHLEKHLVADEVEIEDRTARDAVLGLIGPRASEVVREALGDSAVPGEDHAHRSSELSGAAVRIVCLWRTDRPPAYELIVPRSEAVALWNALREAGAPRGLRLAGMTAYEVVRIEDGIPAPAVDFDESHLVLEAGLERGISFTKGCYLGQEVVERASARGHVNRRLVGLRVDAAAAPEPGAKIVDGGAEIGVVTSAAVSPSIGRAIAFGYARRERSEPGSRVEIESATGRVAAEVVALPFPNPEKGVR